MTLHAVFQVGPTLNYCEWLRINVDVKVLKPCISTEAMRNPSHSSLVIYTAGPGSQTISHLHDHQKRDQMFIISLWILYRVSPSSSSFLWFSLQGLYCFHLSSDTVHYVNYVEPRARQSLRGGGGGSSGLNVKRWLIRVPWLHSYESQSLEFFLQYQYPLSSILGKMWVPPSPTEKAPWPTNLYMILPYWNLFMI